MNDAMKVLILDDDDDFIHFLTLLVRKNHYVVSSAKDGKRGLELARTMHPDIILLDVILPDYNGFDLCRIIKSDPVTANILVILLSGYKISSDDQAAGLESGADGYLIKTMPAREMKARLEIFIDNKQFQKALHQSEALFTAFMDHNPGLVLIKDDSLRLVYVNRTFRERMPADDWMGKTPEECFPAELAADMRTHDEAALSAGYERYEETWPGKDGTLSTYETTKFRIDRQGDRPLLGGLIMDITGRKQADEQIRSQLVELLRWQEVMLEREDRVQELKREVNDLCRALDQPPRYPSQEPGSEDPVVQNPAVC